MDLDRIEPIFGQKFDIVMSIHSGRFWWLHNGTNRRESLDLKRVIFWSAQKGQH